MNARLPFALLALSFASLGCELLGPIDSGFPGGTLVARWSVDNVDGSDGACAPGFETMRVSYDPFDARTDATDSNPTATLFPCADGTGIVELPANQNGSGFFAVTLDETDSSGESVYAADVDAQLVFYTKVDATDGTGEVATTFYPDGGWLWLEWSLFGSDFGDYLASCEAAGVDRIDIEVFDDLADVADPAVDSLSFPCTSTAATEAQPIAIDTANSLGGVLLPFAPGQFRMTAKAFAGNDEVGASSAATTTVETKNKVLFSPAVLSLDITNR